jgi:hypothetical protein
MHWKLKSMIQNAVSLLPSSASYAGYYWIQRHFGGLRRINPVSRLSAGIETWKRVKEQGCDPLEKVFLEIGTGRVPLVPLSYWLMGAKKTITIDLNPYLKGELIGESLRYISDNKQDIQTLFGPLIDKKRLDDLVAFSGNANFSTRTFLDFCKIDYIAPGNATNTGLPTRSIDFHTSYTVFEHISPEALKQILEEGNRIISNDGLFIHRIDYSDHFSHSDRNISAINFLQYSDDEWMRYAGNRYMYMNRLRHDDFVSLFQSARHRILNTQPDIDRRSQELLRSRTLQLNERFKTKSEEILSISASWIVSKKNG